MDVTKFDNAKEYYQTVKGYLSQDEATNCLPLGVARVLCNSQLKDLHLPYLVTVENNRETVATAIQTPPRRLLLAKSKSLEAIKLIAENIALQNKSLPGAIGLKSQAAIFARAWQSLTGQSFELAVAMKIHQLETIQPINTASGKLRLARKGDRELLIEWIEAFEKEALGDNAVQSDYQSWFENNIRKQSLYVWQNKIPVSMTTFGGATPNGIRIGGVYTPPKYRGKGYATSCVAAVSQHLLNTGYKYCFLFTDMANPTSNHIYQKIGYQPVCEISNYGFKSEKIGVSKSEYDSENC